MTATGATIWFGAGSTGKTQLLLWLAAHIAAAGDKTPRQWLGADVNVRGHVLILTAEDLREHVLQRIGMIARRMIDQSGGSDEDVAALCRRIHVMAFLSMDTTEFTEPNPCLFKRGAGGWQPSAVLKGVESFLGRLERPRRGQCRPEDRIVGVILDSAVSMAGFELANSEATTNFLFYLNRLSRRQKMFWAVIGHTPKTRQRRPTTPRSSGCVARPCGRPRPAPSSKSGSPDRPRTWNPFAPPIRPDRPRRRHRRGGQGKLARRRSAASRAAPGQARRL